MVQSIGNLNTQAYTHTEKNGVNTENTPTQATEDKYAGTCYGKMSENDVPMMKGDCGPRLKHTYMRWDKDLQMYDKREKGSLPLLRRNTMAKSLKKKYREFAGIANHVTLGSLRGVYGVFGVTAIRAAIREHGIPEEFRKQQ